MAKSRVGGTTGMTPTEKLLGGAVLVIYVFVLPLTAEALFNGVERLFGISMDRGLRDAVYYYILFALERAERPDSGAAGRGADESQRSGDPGAAGGRAPEYRFDCSFPGSCGGGGAFPRVCVRESPGVQPGGSIYCFLLFIRLSPCVAVCGRRVEFCLSAGYGSIFDSRRCDGLDF